MSKSFTVDLSNHYLYLTVAGKDQPLKRNLDVSDLISVLLDEGFSNFEDRAFYRKIYGDDAGFRESIIRALIGVPRHASINFSRVGNNRNIILVSLDF